MKALLRLLVLAGAVFTLAACNTVQGVGRDIESAGGAIEDAASRD